ncbi:MAG: hypothetical protein JW743_05005 [Deltaproteobacteria bacterium]|nr:hypothetical protein [Deltaproteobacteria bacterium]MBN2846578.1 hypothetical protein [Deltaproteobacteria bacterium]
MTHEALCRQERRRSRISERGMPIADNFRDYRYTGNPVEECIKKGLPKEPL